MAQIAKAMAPDGQNLTTAEISAFADSLPTAGQIIGWLSARCDCYVYIARTDGEPLLHAGAEREGEPQVLSIPGEELTLCVVGAVESDALAQVALTLSVALARRSAQMMSDAKSQGDLLRAVIDRDDDAIERAVAQGWEMDREIFLIVGRFADGDLLDLAEQWRQTIKQRDPKAQVFFFPTEIVAVVGRESVDSQSLAEALPRDGGVIAFSHSGTTRNDLAELYQQCELAISVARRLGRVDDIATLDQLGSYRLLALINDSEALRLFLSDTLGDLAQRSDLEAVDLRRTLQALLDQNMNIAETARALHFHYNTLRYRITKLKRMLGNFDQDPELRLSLSLALRILSLRGVESHSYR